MDAVELAQQAATTGVIAKAAVDLYRKSPIPSPKWMLPTAALFFGISGSFVLGYIDQVAFSGRQIAQSTLMGFLGAAVAVVATEIHDWARQDENK